MKKLVFLFAFVFFHYFTLFSQNCDFMPTGTTDPHWDHVHWDFDVMGDCESCKHYWKVELKGSPYCSNITLIDSTHTCNYEYDVPIDCEYTFFRVTHIVCCTGQDCVECPEEFDPYQVRPVHDDIVARASSIKNHVAVYNNTESTSVQVNLFDVSGRLLFHQEVLPNSTAEFPLQDKQKGVYLLEAVTNGRKQSVKLINQ
jgi:hypothetical protein